MTDRRALEAYEEAYQVLREGSGLRGKVTSSPAPQA